MADLTDSRAKLLLGEAVRLLVQSGATGTAITEFIQGYTVILQATLTAPPADPADLKAQIKEAMVEVLQELGPPGRHSAGTPRKRVSVYIEGAKTTLSLRPELLCHAEEVAGTKKMLRQRIREFANTKPAHQGNRSAWVEEQLQAYIALARLVPGPTPSH